MKFQFLSLAFLFTMNSLFSQTLNCDSIKSENIRLEKDISHLKSTIGQVNNYTVKLKEDSTRLQKEGDYLKQTLNIFQPIKSANKLKIDFNLIACEGDIQEQSVTITFNLINKDTNKDIQFTIENHGRGQTAIDAQGNEFNTDKITVGAKSFRSKLFTDVPLVTKIKFTGVPSSALIFKLVNIKGFTSDEQSRLTNFELQFKDLPVVWK